MPLGIEPSEKHRPLWPFLLAGAAIVALVLLGFGLTSRHAARQAPATKPLPFGPAERSYASNLKFENLQLSRFENMFHQQVTYLAGDVYNAGNRTIDNLEVSVEFQNVEGQVVYREKVRPLGPDPTPLQPGARQTFRLGFDQIPADWNEAEPTIRVTGLALH